MKKVAVCLLLALPAFLLAEEPPKKPLPPQVVQEEPSTPSVEIKGPRALGTKLVEKVWSLAQHHKWKSLKEKMSEHFSGIDSLGDLTTRREEIEFLRGLDIQESHVIVEKVISLNETIIVQYSVNLICDAVDPQLIIPVVRMSVFEKKHGKWLWRADADLGSFLS